jgi:allantoinase
VPPTTTNGLVISPRMKTLLSATLLLAFGTALAEAQTNLDAVTGFPRETREVKEWKPGKRVAVCFVLYVETWGFGLGPNLRSDMTSRKPDLVNEAFRQYAINFGVERAGGVFHEENVPLSVALNAQFPGQHPEVWKRFRALLPTAPIAAHGMNNSSDRLPLDEGLARQESYIKQTLDLIERQTGVRPKGWSSPSVYCNAETFRACAASGLQYTLDSMDSDFLSVLKTPDGALQMISYPPITVDMGQFLTRDYKPGDMERLWIDYVGELAREAEKHPDHRATVVAIGIHPFVIGTPDGAMAMRRTLETLKKNKTIWLTDTEALLQALNAQTR